MAEEELQVIRLRTDFYRDGFTKVFIALCIVFTAIVILVATSIYLFVAKPPPVNFSTDNEFRVVAPVPLDQPYLATADLTQWVSETVPNVFNYDFLNYASRLKTNQSFFTPNGWKQFNSILNTYASFTMVTNGKLFVSTSPNGAPFVVNQGLLNGRYSWWVQMPLNITFGSRERGYTQTITLQVLVVRESTLNNLSGVVIDNMIIPTQATPTGAQVSMDNHTPFAAQVGMNG